MKKGCQILQYLTQFVTVALLAGCHTVSRQQLVSGHSTVPRGSVHGGQQPVSGATIQLYAIGTTGDSSVATPLLSTVAMSDANGNFNFTNYVCPSPSSLVYLVATGGDPGLGTGANNPQLALMTALGQCGNLTPATFVSVNELTTVGAVYALSPYMTSYSAIGSATSNAAALASTFTLASELVDPSVGSAPGTNVPNGMTIPSAQINTIGDSIVTCINSFGGVSGDGSPCGILFMLTTPSGATAPTNTVAALLNLALNPTLNTTAIFNLAVPSSPFQPTDTTPPPDLAIRPQYAVGVSAMPSSLSFLHVTVGFAQGSQAVTVRNNATSPISVNGWGFVGTGASDYLVTDTNCSTALAGGNTCSYTVKFVPTTSGNRAAYLYINNTSANTVLYVPLGGGGAAPLQSVLSGLANGYLAFGDSITFGTGYQPSYPALLDGYFPAGSPFANYGAPGYGCWNQAQSIFTNLQPRDIGNPIVTDMIGFNDAYGIAPLPGTPGAIYYLQCQMGANAYAALSSSNTIAAGSSLPTASGSWAVDATYPNFPGLVSTTQNSCVSVTRNIPNGVFYLWYMKEYASGGSLSITSDNAPAVDTISGTTGLISKIPIYINQTTETYPALARYVVSPGSHLIGACVTSSSNAANDVHVYGFGFPPAIPNTALTAPHVYLGGVTHFQDDPTDAQHPGLSDLNALNQQAAQALAADNLNVTFVDVRAFVDAHFDMLSTPDGSCLASQQPGAHVNNCGTLGLEQAFWEAINGAFAPQ